MNLLAADWEAPPGVTAFTTLRTGGSSAGAYASLNLGDHVGDDPIHVQANRAALVRSQGWRTEPLWLRQVHGNGIARVTEGALRPGGTPEADGAVTDQPDLPLVVLTADCLPVLACDRDGTVVGAFHAGWKGLLAGVLEAGLSAMNRSPSELMVWLGPAIGPDSYQIGPEVRQAYLISEPEHAADFTDDGPGHWKLDLPGAAVRRLRRFGVGSVTRGRWDTLRDADLFFSHRRQAPCGRMGTFIALER